VTLGLPSGIKIIGLAIPSIVTVAFSGIGIEVIINLVRLTPDPIAFILRLRIFFTEGKGHEPVKENPNRQPCSVLHALSVL